LLPKATPQNCVLKLFPKGVPHLKLLFKAAPLQSCTEKLLGLLRKDVSESGFPKMLCTAIPQSYLFSKQLSSILLSKPQSCSPQLLPKAALKIATESRVRKTFPKIPMLLPKAASKLVWKAVQSCSPKLLP
jgi:hypothetical protein